MQKELSKFKSLGANVAVVVRDDDKSVKNYWQEKKLEYFGIPDKNKKLSELYKQQWNLVKLGLMPAMFVIDTDGKIKFVHYSGSMKDIPDNREVLEILGKFKLEKAKKNNR